VSTACHKHKVRPGSQRSLPALATRLRREPARSASWHARHRSGILNGKRWAELASLVMVHHGSSRWGGAAAAATMWCGSFAGLHLFWALGGSVGLASSAGRDLAMRRPASFVIFGLYGTALLLVVGILIIAVTQRPQAARRLRRAASVLMAVVGVGLVLRGLALEVLLATNAAGLRANVGPLETHWSLILWNPWFAVGGTLFIATAIRASRAGFVRGESQ